MSTQADKIDLILAVLEKRKVKLNEIQRTLSKRVFLALKERLCPRSSWLSE